MPIYNGKKKKKKTRKHNIQLQRVWCMTVHSTLVCMTCTIRGGQSCNHVNNCWQSDSAQNMYRNLGRKGSITDAKKIVNKIVEKVSFSFITS